MSPSTTTITIFSLILTISVAAANINDTCKAAAASKDYFVKYDFCETVLRADPGSEKANDHDLALIAVQLSLNNVSRTDAKIHRLIANGNCSQYVKTRLQLCSDNVYTPFIKLVVGVVHSFRRGNYTDSIQRFGMVREHYKDCNSIYSDGHDDPLLKDYDNLLGLTTLASFLISRLM